MRSGRPYASLRTLSPYQHDVPERDETRQIPFVHLSDPTLRLSTSGLASILRTLSIFLPSHSACRFRGYRVISVHCGGCHTMVLASPIPGAAAEDSDNAVETELAPPANGEDHQVRIMILFIDPAVLGFGRARGIWRTC